MRFRILAAVLSVVFVSCEDESDKPGKPAMITAQEALGDAVKAVRKGGSGNSKQPLANAARLAEFLPESVEGLKRFELRWSKKHSRAPTREASATFAKSTHEAQTGPSVAVELMDMGRMAKTLSGIVRSAFDYDRDGESARVFTLKGRRGVEQVDKPRNEATILLPLSDRLMVTINGRKAGIDLCRAALKSVDLAALARADLTQPSKLERMKLPDTEQVKAAYPDKLFGKPHARITAMPMGGPERPHIFARGLYANMIMGEVRVYKTAAHAAADRPIDAIKTYFGYLGNGLEVGKDTWRGTPIVIVSAPRSGGQAILRIVKGCVALDVRGPDKPDQLKKALDAFEALLSLAPTNGGGS